MAASDDLDPSVRPRLEALIERNRDGGCVNLSELTELAESLELDDDAHAACSTRPPRSRASR